MFGYFVHFSCLLFVLIWLLLPYFYYGLRLVFVWGSAWNDAHLIGAGCR